MQESKGFDASRLITRLYDALALAMDQQPQIILLYCQQKAQKEHDGKKFNNIGRVGHSKVENRRKRLCGMGQTKQAVPQHQNEHPINRQGRVLCTYKEDYQHYL
ncbi:hypothetical protein AXF42_Ash003349 [Apostasia shenzhenica]|uniref:Uncharacterized protein n=1 Tax=Apostasia shenzhenica TaxID=1088818 RepID=A0A2I0BFZ1_9ASPA|nr:hypothetical protein AXF42_Ash003349 [Apostasia shenzhenica]